MSEPRKLPYASPQTPRTVRTIRPAVALACLAVSTITLVVASIWTRDGLVEFISRHLMVSAPLIGVAIISLFELLRNITPASTAHRRISLVFIVLVVALVGFLGWMILMGMNYVNASGGID